MRTTAHTAWQVYATKVKDIPISGQVPLVGYIAVMEAVDALRDAERKGGLAWRWFEGADGPGVWARSERAERTAYRIRPDAAGMEESNLPWSVGFQHGDQREPVEFRFATMREALAYCDGLDSLFSGG